MNLKGRIFSHFSPVVAEEILHRLGRPSPWHAEFDFTPPELREGEAIGPPDFVGIGAQNSGTFWWYNMIFLHPGVARRTGLPKELHFFDRFGGELFSDSMVDWYHGWFPRRPGTLAGEWTSEYFDFPWVPKLLHEAAPQARLLLLLRDPVDRVRSIFDHRFRKRQHLAGQILSKVVEPGFYNQTLQQWYEVFDPSQFLILQYERCIADTDGELKSTFDYLGLTEYHSAETERPRSPASFALRETSRLDLDVKNRLVDLYTRDVVALAHNVPHLDLSLWPNFAHLAGGQNRMASAHDLATPGASG
jgi:hypothetical protein